MFKTRKSGEARVLAAGKQGMGRIPLAHTCPGVVRYTPRPGFANGAMSALQPSPRGRRLPKIHTKGMAWRVASREACKVFLPANRRKCTVFLGAFERYIAPAPRCVHVTSLPPGCSIV